MASEDDGESPAEDRGVQLVVQRCNKAQLLVDNQDEWVEIGTGLVVYVSFAKGATEARVLKAARTLLHLPLVTEGKWGDGVQPASVLQKCSEGVECSILVVPQASLSCKVKGKLFNYRGQLEKDMSRQFYDTFVAELSTAAHEAFNPTPPKAKARKPEVPPEDPLIFFHEGIYAGKYSEYDDRGVPIRTSDGQDLSKAHAKKLERLHCQQVEKYRKHLARLGGGAAPRSTPTSQADSSTGYDKDLSAIPPEGKAVEKRRPRDPSGRPKSSPAVAPPATPSELHPQPDGEGGAPDPTATTEPLPTAAGGSPDPGQPKYVLPRVVAGTFGNLQ
eukprot:EG_transcript_19141